MRPAEGMQELQAVAAPQPPAAPAEAFSEGGSTAEQPHGGWVAGCTVSCGGQQACCKV
jgi:hypothetical protein